MTTADERRTIISAEVPLEHKQMLMRIAAEGDRSLSRGTSSVERVGAGVSR